MITAQLLPLKEFIAGIDVWAHEAVENPNQFRIAIANIDFSYSLMNNICNNNCSLFGIAIPIMDTHILGNHNVHNKNINDNNAMEMLMTAEFFYFYIVKEQKFDEKVEEEEIKVIFVF